MAWRSAESALREASDSVDDVARARLEAVRAMLHAVPNIPGLPLDRALVPAGCGRASPLKRLSRLRQGVGRATRDAQPGKRTIIPGSVRVWQGDGVAAVSSVVQLEGQPEQFTNTRVFTAGNEFGYTTGASYQSIPRHTDFAAPLGSYQVWVAQGSNLKPWRCNW